MEIINGFSIIASVPTRDGLRIILGVRVTGNVTSYVTAEARDETTGEWWWGHYYDAASRAEQPARLIQAADDLGKRVERYSALLHGEPVNRV